MDHSVAVEVLDGVADLDDIVLDFKLMEPLPPPDEILKRLVLAQLKNDVHVLLVFEKVLKADDILVVEGPVYFDLRHQRLLGPAFPQSRFGDDLRS